MGDNEYAAGSVGGRWSGYGDNEYAAGNVGGRWSGYGGQWVADRIAVSFMLIPEKLLDDSSMHGKNAYVGGKEGN